MNRERSRVMLRFRRLRRRAAALALGVLGWAGAGGAAYAVTPDAVGVDEHVGARLPLDLRARDQDGQERPLASALSGERPVVLQLAYYHCPLLCDLTLRTLAQRLRALGWHAGTDYDALTVSIDPHDSVLTAGAKREKLLALLPAPAPRAWPFFVAQPPVITGLTRALGYRYTYDARSEQFAHPAVTIVLTPAGVVSRYLYGPDTDTSDLSLALREARAGRASPTPLVDRVILSCFHYDPSTRRYGFLLSGVLRGGAALIALSLATLVWWFARRGRGAAGRVTP